MITQIHRLEAAVCQRNHPYLLKCNSLEELHSSRALMLCCGCKRQHWEGLASRAAVANGVCALHPHLAAEPLQREKLHLNKCLFQLSWEKSTQVLSTLLKMASDFQKCRMTKWQVLLAGALVGGSGWMEEKSNTWRAERTGSGLKIWVLR